MVPTIEMRPIKGQMDDLGGNYERARKYRRVLVTTLTKKMAGDQRNSSRKWAFAFGYLHSDIVTMSAAKSFVICVPVSLTYWRINLLREGLDMPEVSLVAILDAGQGRVLAF